MSNTGGGRRGPSLSLPPGLAITRLSSTSRIYTLQAKGSLWSGYDAVLAVVIAVGLSQVCADVLEPTLGEAS